MTTRLVAPAARSVAEQTGMSKGTTGGVDLGDAAAEITGGGLTLSGRKALETLKDVELQGFGYQILKAYF